MPRLHLFFRAPFAVCLCLIAATTAAAAAAPRPPNVLFIAVDDLRCELGCFGATHVRTPNLDRLAASGVLFTRAYCQQAVCNASRVSLMTGLRPDATKVWDLVTDFRTRIPGAVTIPQHFRAHGYRAIAYGKIFHNTFPDDVSWDEPTRYVKGVIAHSEANQQRLRDYRAKMKADGRPQSAIERMRGPATEIQEQPDERNFDGRQTTEALARLRELAAGPAPFFLAVGYIRPHLPFITPRQYWELYDRAKIPLARNPFLPRGAPAVAYGDRSFGGFYELRGYMDYADAPSPFERPLTEAQQRELKHGYYASVSFIDAQVGRLLAGLDTLGLAQNTVVVLWSDHGWKLGEHNGWCKQTNYEIDTHAPLLIRAPGARANGRPNSALVEFVDIYPTLCDLAGLPKPAALAGRSLAPLLAGTATEVKEAAFSQFPRKQDGRDYMGYAMRTDRYRYVEWLDATDGRIAARELYDHANDADENDNLAEQPERTAALEALSAQLWRHLPRPQFPLELLRTAAVGGGSGTLGWHPADGRPLPAARPAGEFRSVTFRNTRAEPAELVWIGADGSRKSYRVLQQGETFSIRTRPGAVWLVVDAQQQPLGHFVVEARPERSATALIP
jgi:arylsulfatase A-like enzyme